MTKSRQLAAIMFTDIVGYTALMGRDTSKALELIEVNKAIQKPLIEKHHGQWLKEMGDGALARFPSALDALQCAIEIQKRAKSELDGQLRIGIHLGDITIDQNEIYGDGVNIASRLEQLADPGGIYVSDGIIKSIRGQSSIPVKDLGEIRLKNVDYPLKIYAVVGPDFPPPNLQQAGSKRSPAKSRTWLTVLILVLLGLIIAGFWVFGNWGDNREMSTSPNDPLLIDKSIAVLPFADMSPEKDQEYLGDGLAEEIINVLTKIDGLKVIGRTSSFSFKDQNADLKDIGDKLGVSYILEGSVRKAEDQIRVTAQLINSIDGSHLWSTNYDNQLQDIFAIQDSIAQNLAKKFALTLDLSKSANPPTTSIAAYELFLKGREFHQIGLAGTDRAMYYLEEALILDPHFCDAAALLSFVYWQHILYELGDRKIFESKAKAMAERAIQADPESYQGYIALAWLQTALDFAWDSARDNYEKAIAQGMPIPYPSYSMFKSITTGSAYGAINDMKHLLINDPLSVDLLTRLSRNYLFTRQFDQVIANGEKTLQIMPNNTSVKRHMATSYLSLGRFDEAEKVYGELYEYNPRYSPHGYIGVLSAIGKVTRAREILDETKYQINPGKVAISYMYLEEPDSTFHYLEKALEEKDFYMILIRLDPHYDKIKHDARYLDLLDRMNFPDGDDTGVL